MTSSAIWLLMVFYGFGSSSAIDITKFETLEECSAAGDLVEEFFDVSYAEGDWTCKLVVVEVE